MVVIFVDGAVVSTINSVVAAVVPMPESSEFIVVDVSGASVVDKTTLSGDDAVIMTAIGAVADVESETGRVSGASDVLMSGKIQISQTKSKVGALRTMHALKSTIKSR